MLRAIGLGIDLLPLADFLAAASMILWHRRRPESACTVKKLDLLPFDRGFNCSRAPSSISQAPFQYGASPPIEVESVASRLIFSPGNSAAEMRMERPTWGGRSYCSSTLRC